MQMRPPKLSAYQREICDYIGHDYTLHYIDGSWSLWKKLNDRYDIEILGSYSRTEPFVVIVCDISRGEWHPPVVERVENILTLAQLDETLAAVTWRYSDRGKA